VLLRARLSFMLRRSERRSDRTVRAELHVVMARISSWSSVLISKAVGYWTALLLTLNFEIIGFVTVVARSGGDRKFVACAERDCRQRDADYWVR